MVKDLNFILIECMKFIKEAFLAFNLGFLLFFVKSFS